MPDERLDHLTPEVRTVWAWCADDFVELFGIVAVLRQEHGPLPSQPERVRALTALKELLDLGMIEIRDQASWDSVYLWSEGPSEAIDRLDREWTAEPQMGSPPWFVATPRD